MVHPAETLPAASYRAGRPATSAPAAGGHDATANWAVTGAILGAGILGLLAIFAETVRSACAISMWVLTMTCLGA